jgi:predicted amidohydrolase
LEVAETPDASVSLAVDAIAEAGRRGADVVCFPECFVPGYRWRLDSLPPPDPEFLQRAHAAVASAARAARTTVILGTERITQQGLQITALVTGPDGSTLGWQDKVQLDPSEDFVYPSRGSERRVFSAGPLTFGIVICHEGWRYPETVRWAARRGAQVVFHPAAQLPEPTGDGPSAFAELANSFHEKAILCRAAENTCYFASVSCAIERATITSAIARPDGSLLCYQPYGRAGLLIADLELEAATGLLAARCRTNPL